MKEVIYSFLCFSLLRHFLDTLLNLSTIKFLNYFLLKLLMAEEKKEIQNKEKIEEFTSKLRENPWIVSTIVVSIVALVLLILTVSPGLTGNVISGASAAQNLIDYAKSAGVDLQLVGVNDKGSFYEVDVLLNGSATTFPVTKDGKYLISGVFPITQQLTQNQSQTSTQPTEVPKSDKPVVELFVMSYCPYGTQAEKGIIPAIEALGNKIDFKLRFVDYAMHEKKEIDENTRQYCIQKEQSDKLLPYLKCFLKAGDSSSCLTEVGVNSAKLSSCISSTDTQFKITANYNDQSTWIGQYPPFNVDKALNDNYGVGGSPTLVINGVQSNAGRDSASYLTGICAAFNTAPAECSQTFSSENPSSGFGYVAGTGAATASCG